MYGTAASVLIHATIARISEMRKMACVGAFKFGMGTPSTEKCRWIKNGFVPATLPSGYFRRTDDDKPVRSYL
jgi:hypothetical protein